MSARATTLRWIDGDHISGAVPSEIVHRSLSVIVLFQPSGSKWMRAVGERGGPGSRNMVVGGWGGGHESVEWTGDGVVRVHRFGDCWSTWRWIDAEGNWSDYLYVNLEEPWRETAIGFDSSDWILDLIATPEGQWKYKDEDELDWALESGKYDAALVSKIRATGESVVPLIERGEWPFGADWDAWKPMQTVAVPVLSAGWDESTPG